MTTNDNDDNDGTTMEQRRSNDGTTRRRHGWKDASGSKDGPCKDLASHGWKDAWLEATLTDGHMARAWIMVGNGDEELPDRRVRRGRVLKRAFCGDADGALTHLQDAVSQDRVRCGDADGALKIE